jgi:serine-protein kinase ATM
MTLLTHIVALIASTKVADRTSGLKDLVHILRNNRNSHSLETLGNKAYLALCETIIQCMRDERTASLYGKPKSSKTSKTSKSSTTSKTSKSSTTSTTSKSSKSSKTTGAAALLPLSANALRHVVNSGVRTIKSSTVEMIVYSIVELLPGKDGSLLGPLMEDLPKALRTVLEHQPHVERLSQDCWDTTLDFCIKSLCDMFVEPEVDLPDSWSTSISSRGRTPFESTDGGPRPTPRDSAKSKPSVANEVVHAAEDLVHFLQLLVKASNSPLISPNLDKAESIIMTLIQYLQQRIGRGNGAALTAINLILPRITLHASQLTERVMQELLPLMKILWSDLSLRDEMMIALSYTEVYVAKMLANTKYESVSFNLEDLIETMYNDYRRRQESTAHQFLEEDHLSFRLLDTASDPPSQHLCIFFGNGKSAL